MELFKCRVTITYEVLLESETAETAETTALQVFSENIAQGVIPRNFFKELAGSPTLSKITIKPIAKTLTPKTGRRIPKPSDRELDNLFNLFWEAYPHKLDKEQARKTFKKLNPDKTLVDKILDAVKWQKQSGCLATSDPKYCPYPSTWLSKKRWEDEKMSFNASTITGTGTSANTQKGGENNHSYDLDAIENWARNNVPKAKGREEIEAQRRSVHG